MPDVDLGLLPTLEMVIRERSVTRAAYKLGVSQPTVSRILARLRHQLGDPLLVRTKGGVEPTPRALHIVEPLARALEEVRRALASELAFDPALATATFSLSLGDYESAVLLPGLYARVSVEAPRARLAIIPYRRAEAEEAVMAGKVHVAVGRFLNPAPALHQQQLFREDFVVGFRQGHPLATQTLSLAGLARFPHILISPGRPGDFTGLLDEAFAEAGLSRHVAVSLPHFLVAPALLLETDAVLLFPRHVARWAVAVSGLCIRALPIPTAGFCVTMLWHGRTHKDAGAVWLRRLLFEVAAGKASGPGATEFSACPP
jgi:DNA-binding transcriptional LysR family regulator